jgi:hypothetical protein
MGSNDEARRAEAASAYRGAGQWAATFDRERATELLTLSGQIWMGLGHGFGAFLLATVAPHALNTAELRQWIVALGRWHLDGDIAPDDLPAPLRVPQQQAYCAMAAAAVPEVRDEVGPVVRKLADLPANSRGVLPIGPLGVPVRRYWGIATELADPGPTTRGLVFRAVEDLAVRHAAQIDLAKSNRYLWENGGAPVDVVDVDLLGVSNAAVTRFGRDLVARRFELFNDRHPAIAAELGLVAEMSGAPLGRDPVDDHTSPTQPPSETPGDQGPDLEGPDLEGPDFF